MTVDDGHEPIYKDFSQNTHKTADSPPNRLNVSLSCALVDTNIWYNLSTKNISPNDSELSTLLLNHTTLLL